jgi:hypothetical protein
MNLCKDCQYCDGNMDNPTCHHPNAADPVTGEFKSPCYIMRDVMPHHCGPYGKWFIAKIPGRFMSTPPDLKSKED